MTAPETVPWDELSHEEQLKYARVRYENERRDGNAEWWAWRLLRVLTGNSIGLILITLTLAWAVYHVGRVQVKVQVVQHDEQGRLVTVGVPVDLLAYQPQDGAYRNMLAQWIDLRHWRNDNENDPQAVRARYNWRWLYLHSCGQARKQLEEAEAKEKPFKFSTKRVQVDVDTITKTEKPDRYHVTWRSRTTDKQNPKPDEATWTTTFTVGRVAPKTLSDATLNNLGLCVTAYDNDKVH